MATGDIAAPDAARVSEVALLVFVVDASQPPPGVHVAGIAYVSFAQVTWNTGGSLSYAHTMPADRPLPVLPDPYRYRAAVQLIAPQTRAFGRAETRVMSEATPAFNVTP